MHIMNPPLFVVFLITTPEIGPPKEIGETGQFHATMVHRGKALIISMCVFINTITHDVILMSINEYLLILVIVIFRNMQFSYT